jgi:sugar phosphate permease
MSLLGSFIARQFGWQAVFLLPGMWTIFASTIAFYGIRNSPEELSSSSSSSSNVTASDSDAKRAKPTNTRKSFSGVVGSAPATPTRGAQIVHQQQEQEEQQQQQQQQPQPQPTTSEIFKQHLLRNVRLWLLCLATLCHDLVRTGWADWGFFLLIQERKLSAIVAGRFVRRERKTRT